MIVDTSAMVAVAQREPAATEILSVIYRAPLRRVSAANLLEFWMVMGRRARPTDLHEVVEGLDLAIEPVTAQQVEIARSAFMRYGKGSGHGARLNFGDCFAYALAKHLEEPLLFVGNDFSLTDITPALRRDDQSGSADRE